MEILIEALIEVFGEIILEGIAYLVAEFFHIVSINSKLKRTIKYSLVFIMYSLIIALLIFSLCTKKGQYVTPLLAYLCVSAVIYLFKFISINLWDNHGRLVLKVLSSLCRYALGVCLIVIGCKNINQTSGVVIVVLSSISLVICLVIDIFRIYRAVKNKKEKIED